MSTVVPAWGKHLDVPPDVFIHVQDRGFPGNVVIAQARHIVTAMFADIGVTVLCASAERGPLESAVTIALEVELADTVEAGTPEAVAYAQPFDPRARTVTLMWNRLQDRCLHAPRLLPVLLAHVIVHEVTHVLQSSGRHSDTGVMKARFTSKDLNQMLVRRLAFTTRDIELIHSGVARLRASERPRS